MSRKVKTQTGQTRHEIRWQEDGRERRRRFRTAAEANRAELEVKDAARRRRAGLKADVGPITLAELVERFTTQHQIRPQSLIALQSALKHSVAAFGDVRVRELRPEEIARWNANLPLSPRTRTHALKALRQVLNAGIEWGYLEVSPARPSAVKSPRNEAPEVRPFESWAEVERLETELGPIASFACATGLRPQEWQALQWSDVDIEQRRLQIRRTVQAGKLAPLAKTAASLRTVLLSKRAINALLRLPTPLRPDQLVFPNPRGEIISLKWWRRHDWHPAVLAAELDDRPPYQMRHTFACLALAQGATIHDVSRQLGHTDIQTTLRYYVRFLPAADERFLEALDRERKTA
jgi:integrase